MRRIVFCITILELLVACSAGVKQEGGTGVIATRYTNLTRTMDVSSDSFQVDSLQRIPESGYPGLRQLAARINSLRLISLQSQRDGVYAYLVLVVDEGGYSYRQVLATIDESGNLIDSLTVQCEHSKDQIGDARFQDMELMAFSKWSTFRGDTIKRYFTRFLIRETPISWRMDTLLTPNGKELGILDSITLEEFRKGWVEAFWLDDEGHIRGQGMKQVEDIKVSESAVERIR